MNSFIRRMYHTLQQLLTTATQNTATNINFSFIKQPFIFTASCIVLYIIECFTAKPQFLESIKRPDPAIITQMRDLPCWEEQHKAYVPFTSHLVTQNGAHQT